MQQGVQPGFLGLVEVAQDVRHDQMALARMADAHAAPAEVGAQVADQAADAVLARCAAAGLHAEAARGQVDLVVEDDDLAGFDLVEARRLADRAAALVHIGLRFHQQDLDRAVGAVDLAFADDGLELGPLGTEAPAARDLVHGHEADVVAVLLVFGARIAEPCDDDHADLMPFDPGKEKPRAGEPGGAEIF
ncbi:hypothetical protein D3C86_1158110 [compost metagenome]